MKKCDNNLEGHRCESTNCVVQKAIQTLPVRWISTMCNAGRDAAVLSCGAETSPTSADFEIAG